MKTIYTVSWNSKKHKGALPFKFKKRSHADQLASIIARLFHVDVWTCINNTYTDTEIADIRQAYQRALEHPLDHDDVKVWHWKE